MGNGLKLSMARIPITESMKENQQVYREKLVNIAVFLEFMASGIRTGIDTHSFLVS